MRYKLSFKYIKGSEGYILLFFILVIVGYMIYIYEFLYLSSVYVFYDFKNVLEKIII